MYSFSGLVNGNTIIASESLHAFEGRSVIITILDDTVTLSTQAVQNKKEEERKAAARELAGMWKSYDTGRTVDETVRELRRGRHRPIRAVFD